MEKKWEGKVSTILPNTPPHQIWPLVKDFFNLHKWFPTLSNCHGVHGSNGAPGCIRYCCGFSLQPVKNSDNQKINGGEVVNWSKERLLAVDEVNRSLSYEIVDCNIGFESYKSTVKISPLRDDDEDGCMIEWSFSVDPVKGMTFEELVNKYEVGLQEMGKKMEDFLTSS